jgi:hypothetical protein
VDSWLTLSCHIATSQWRRTVDLNFL